MSIPISFHSNAELVRGRYFEARGGGPSPTVLLLPGSPGNQQDVLGLGERFAQSSYNVLTFNYRGTHGSEGRSSFANAQLDIAAAYRFLMTSEKLGVDPKQVILGGWSYGGGMAVTYAAGHREVSAVFSIAGTDHGEFMREYERDPEYRRVIDQIFDDMTKPDSPWRLSPGATPREALELGLSVDDYDLRIVAPDLVDTDVLLVGGWNDLNVKIENHMLPLYRALKRSGAQEVSMIAFHDDHSFSSVRDGLGDSIVSWMDERAHRAATDQV